MARPRKKKATEAAPERSPQEAALCEKYPLVNIVPGSWRAPGGRDGWGTKATVVTLCPCSEAEGKDVTTVRATSDLFQVGSLCQVCSKARSKNKAAKRKEAK